MTEKFKIGDMVKIQDSDALLDCCAGKRGRIVHRPAGGGSGWLLHTNHFCPIVRDGSELTLVTQETLAREILEAAPDWVRQSYEEAEESLLAEHAKDGDVKARAVLILRGQGADDWF